MKDKIRSKVWLDLLTGETVDRPATRVNENSTITTSIVDVEYDKNGDKKYKEREVKKWN